MSMLVKYKDKNRQPNKLTTARYKLTAIEKRIFYLVINQMKTGKNVGKNLLGDNEFYIEASALGDTNYNRLKKAAEKLVSRQIQIEEQGKKDFKLFAAFTTFEYKDKEGIIKLTVHKDVLPFFRELNKGFTEYKLKAAMSLTSFYSMRLYEMLSRFKDTGWWNSVEITYLKKLLNIEGKYKNVNKFRERVLEQARKEINEKTELTIDYEMNKTGRKYTHIDFTIHFDPDKADVDVENLNGKNGTKAQKCLKILDKLGVSKKVYRKTIIEEKQKEFWKWYYYYQGNSDTIRNPAGHLLKTLGLVE